MMTDLFYASDSWNIILFHAINNIQDAFLIKSAIVTSAAAKYTMFPLYLIILAVIVKKSGKDLKHVLAPLVIAYIVYIAWVSGLKHLLHVPRPYIILPQDSLFVIDTVKNAEDPYARFPSGHAGFSMTMLVALWSLLNRTGKIIGCTVLIYIGVARVELGLHLPSDIILTWIMALSISYITIKASRKLFEGNTA